MNVNPKTLAAIASLTTTVGTIVGALGTLALDFYKLRHESTAELQRSYTSISMCLEEISRFYNDEKVKRFDPDCEQTPKLRKEAGMDWVKRRRFSATVQPGDKRVSKCRQKCRKYFEMAYDLLDKKAIDKKIFHEQLYASSGNFLDVVEPLDEANFIVNFENCERKYREGNNRPAIYKKIEEARNHPDTRKYF